jgi:hypothetical protein
MVLMAASRRRAAKKSDLGDSWVVEDSDSDESSLDEEPSAVPAKLARRQPSMPQNLSTSAHSGQRRRSSRTSSSVPEPELIMPSIHEGQVEGSWISSNGHSRAIASPRKRNPKTAVSSSLKSSRFDRKFGRSSQAEDTQKFAGSEGEAEEHTRERVWSVAGHTADWFLDVFGGALKALRKPISLVIALYLFAGILVMVQNILTRSIYSALSPVCRIPGVSLLGLPICRSPLSQGYLDSPNAPVEFEQLMNVQGQFEEVLEASAAGVSLPLDMKRGETSIRDLRQIVRFSHLNSKQEMILELDGFIETARIASYDLQKFNSHIGRGVDNVLATARWTQRVLDDIATKSNRGFVSGFFPDKFLAPFQPLKFTENTLLSQYIEHTRIVSDEIETLIAEAQALLYVLQNLEDRLDVVHGIALRDDIHAQGQKEEILSQLWTLLGGNRAALGKYNSQLKLLRQVGEYRKIAWAHVSGTIIRLQAMGAELEELRERVGGAEILKEIPLAVHLESIRLGVERLEKGRESSRELEQNHLNRVLDRGGKDNEMRLVEG